MRGLLFLFLLCNMSALIEAGESKLVPIDIGSRLELFVDGVMVDRLEGDIQLRLNRPVPREVVLELEEPWEASFIYFTVLEDDGMIRLYYSARSPERGPQAACVAESLDGIHFTRPELDVHEYFGRSINNVVWRHGPAVHHFSPFIDTNPAAPADKRYKGLARRSGGGFGAYYSADGFRWEVAEDSIFSSGPSDSQNIAFWDPLLEVYVAYAREFIEIDGRRFRTIRRAFSKDYFSGWEETGAIQYTDDRAENLYTNGILPYFRAPHIYIGLAGRFVTGRRKLEGHPEAGIGEGALIASRDGKLFYRWEEAFIRPGTDAESWGDRSHFPALGMVQTSPEEISVYWNDHYRYDSALVRRGTIRTDGFVSVSAAAAGGELLTVPFIFAGDRLVVNYETSAGGSIRFELTDEEGVAIDGFSTGGILFGNEIEQVVEWRGGGDVGALAGKPVRLRVFLNDADFYSFRFTEAAEIRSRLLEVHANAAEILSRGSDGFLSNGLGRLETKFQLLDNRLTNDADITQGAIQSAAMVERQIAEYVRVEAIAAQAESILEQAAAVAATERGAGELYKVPVQLLAEIVNVGLADSATTPDELSGDVGRLQSAISDWERLLALRASVAEEVSMAGDLVRSVLNDFGRPFQNRVATRKQALELLLDDPDATLGGFRQAAAGLNDAVASMLRLPPVLPPLEPVSVPGLPFTFDVRTDSQWRSGLLVGVVPTGSGLLLEVEQAMEFPDIESYVVATGTAALKPEQVTIEVWLKIPDHQSRWSPVFVLGSDPQARFGKDEYSYLLWLRGGQPEFAIGGRDGHQLRTGTGSRLSAGEWHHIAAVYDGKEAKLYVNGKLERASPFEGGMDYHFSDVLQVGGQFGRDRNTWFRGMVRDLRIWAEARDAEQIRRDMEADITGNESGLAGAWFSGRLPGEGARIYDHSHHANHATLENAGWVFEDGYWLSNPIHVGSGDLTSSQLEWVARIEGNPIHAAIRVEAGFSPAADELPERWQRAASGGAIPGLAARNPNDQYIWLRVSMSRSDPSSFPILESIRLRLK